MYLIRKYCCETDFSITSIELFHSKCVLGDGGIVVKSTVFCSVLLLEEDLRPKRYPCFFVNFMKKEFSTKFYGVFNNFSGTYKVTNCFLTVTSSTRTHINNMLIVAYM